MVPFGMAMAPKRAPALEQLLSDGAEAFHKMFARNSSSGSFIIIYVRFMRMRQKKGTF